MKKLLIVTNIPSPYRVDFFYYLQQNEKDYEIHIMFQSGNENSFRTWKGGEEKLDNVHFLKSRVIKKVGFDETEKFIPAGVGKELNEIRPEIVVCMEYNPCAIMVKHWCNKKKVPYISWSDGTRHSERNIGLLQRLSRKYIIRNSAAFIASSTATKENQIFWGADDKKIYISYLTVDVDKYMIDRTLDNRNADIIKLLFVGRVVKLKGLELLLPVIKRLEKNIHLIIAGDGPELSEIKNMAEDLKIADRVDYKGYIEGDSLKKCYEESDVFILPTKNDCYGLVILEAMCAGLPVIVSKYADGAPDLVEDNVTGYIIDPYDPDQVESKIKNLLSDKRKLFEMGKAGRKKAEGFSFENVSKGFMEAVNIAGRSDK